MIKFYTFWIYKEYFKAVYGVWRFSQSNLMIFLHFLAYFQNQHMQQHQQQSNSQPNNQQAAPAPAPARAGKGKHADGKPRGRMTAYAFFVQTCREEHKKKHPDEQVIFAEFSKKCAERWKVSEFFFVYHFV